MAFRLTTHRTLRRPGKPWWNDQCAQAVRAHCQAWNRWRRAPLTTTGEKYRRLDAICARTISRAKEAWDSYCSSLSFFSSTKRTWAFLHAMEGKKTRNTMPLTDNTQSALDDTQKAALMATHYQQKIGLPSNIQPPQDPSTVIQEALNLPGPPDLTQSFTRGEFKAATSTLKAGKTPGPDLIPYEFLTHLTHPLQDHLLNIYNLSWLSGEFPTCWKTSTLIPIPKPGKNPTHPSSYRPIALLSCVGKLMERLVAARLTWWLEEKCLLKEEQCGFRTPQRHHGRAGAVGLPHLRHIPSTTHHGGTLCRPGRSLRHSTPPRDPL